MPDPSHPRSPQHKNQPSLSIQPPTPISPPTCFPSFPSFSSSPPQTPVTPLSRPTPAATDRLATLHLVPQYIFPSVLNGLSADREIPYAFNHHSLSFYWTRADALADIAWSIWARPPCLNCVVACQGDQDGDLARRCDFADRRDRSFGKVQACSRCASQWQQAERRCVEQVEVRRDGSLSATNSDLAGLGMWSPRERRLRRMGVVQWRVVNLLVGDVEGKKEVVQDWERMRETRSLNGERENWILPVGSGAKDGRDPRAVARARAELTRDFETLEGKRLRMKAAVARVAEWDRHDIVLGLETEEPSMEKMDEHLEPARLGREHPVDHLTERQPGIAEQKRFWRLRIQAESVYFHDAELKRNGVQAAVAAESKWKADATQVLREVDDWLDLALRGRAQGISELGFAGHAAEKLSVKTRHWLNILVPRIWGAFLIPKGTR